jgi:hypothetical protein
VQFYVLRSFGDIVANHVGSGSLISELNVSEDFFMVQTDIPSQYPYRCQTFSVDVKLILYHSSKGGGVLLVSNLSVRK